MDRHCLPKPDSARLKVVLALLSSDLALASCLKSSRQSLEAKGQKKDRRYEGSEAVMRDQIEAANDLEE